MTTALAAPAFGRTVGSALPMPSRTRLRMTRRGRRAAAAVLAAPLAIAIAWGALSGGAASASRDAGAPAGTFSTVTVAPGDSLWSIAVSVAPHEDPRDVIDAIVRLNALDSSVVSVGDRLSIPAF